MAKIKLPPRLPFKNIGLAGLGLIGGSLAKALMPFGGLTLYAFDHDPATVEAARRSRRFEAVTGEADTFLNWPLDLAYLCLPVQRNVEMVERMGLLKVPYAVTDAGSTKGSITRAALAAGLNFCGGHPIAGREVSGYAHADAGLWRGCLFVLTPPEAGRRETRLLTAKLQALHELLDCRVKIMSAEEHDRLYGLVSHLPYLAACSLSGSILDAGGEAALAWAGTGFQDSTRISAAAPGKWVEIALDNADNLLENLSAMSAKLDEFIEALESRDAGRLTALLEPIAEFRRKYRNPKKAG